VLYKCVKKCFFKNRLYDVGEPVNIGKGEKVPSHFVLTKDFKKEKVGLEAKDKEAAKAIGHTTVVPSPLDKVKRKTKQKPVNDILE
jgi:hypothetical protein